MRRQLLIYSIIGFITVLSLHAFAQCPVNLDFEKGDFRNWECKTGTVDHAGGANLVSWTSGSNLPEFNHHDIIAPGDVSVDSYGGFPRHCPNSSGYSVKLGNDMNGKEADGLAYTFSIPSTNNKFALVYYYAIVLQNPGHSETQQPRFRARVVDAFTGAEINCVSFDFTASGGLPGFVESGDVVYRDWTPITVDLSGYAGRTLTLEFISTDCTLGGHFGYAYIDVNSTCTQIIEGTAFCDLDTTITLKGPFGFQAYDWYTDLSFAAKKATTQNITVTISSAGSIFPLVLTPWPGFGCADTLYAHIKIASKPVSDAGPDKTTCSNEPVMLGGPPGGEYSYLWTPATYLTESQVRNPVVEPILTGPTWFYVTTTDTTTGCFQIDSALITPFFVDTSISSIGRLVYCPRDPVNLQLKVNNTVSAVQWFQNNNLIPGANQLTYKPVETGKYWARITQSGCHDTSTIYTVGITNFPTAKFTPDKDFQCTKYPILFKNQTTFTGSVEPSYTWVFGDGNSANNKNAENTFTIAGKYNVKLVSSLFDCKDSITKTVTIMKNCFPLVPTAFTPNNDGINDRLKPITPGLKSLKRFSVVNRYGNFVFTTSREGDSWDGHYNGRPAVPGVYIWMLEYVANDGTLQQEKGTVALIR